MNLGQEISADDMMSIADSMDMLSIADPMGDIFDVFDETADDFISVLGRRIDEMLAMVARRFSDAAISKYLKTRSRPSCGGVGDGDGAICIVCRDELHCHGGDGGDQGVMMIATLGCGHEYHVPCIKQWLLLKNACPLCKAPTVPKRRWLWR